MLAYDYSCMTCDSCGKTFPTFNNELVMQYRYGRLLHLCKDCITNNNNVRWVPSKKEFTNVNNCDKIN